MIQAMRKVIITLILIVVIAISFSTPSYAVDSLCAVITSLPTPQSGQKNRSSGNFSTQDCGPRLKWRTPGNIEYRVMKDKSVGSDPVIIGNGKDGLVTNPIDSRSLYIANPTNASGNFEVTILKTEDSVN